MIVLLIYIISVIIVLNFFQKKLGQFNIIFIFSLFHIAYTLMIPIELILFKELSRFNVLINDETNTLIYWSFISYLGFVLPFLFLNRCKLGFFNIHNYNPKNIKKVNLFIFFMTYIIFGILFLRDYIIKAGTYEGNIELSSSSSYKFYIQIGIYFLSYIIMILTINKKFIQVILLLITALLWSIYSSDKNPLYITSFTFLLCLGPILKNKRSVFYLFIFILIIPIISVLFTSYRSNNLDNFAVVGSLYSNSDPKGPYQSILFYEQQLRTNNIEKQYGFTYLESTIQWIPTSIWDKRPEDLSVKFAKKTLNNYSKGLGLGFSPIAEGIINFGFHGPFFGHLILSFSLISLLLFARSLFKSNSSLNLSVLLFITIYILLMNRVHYAIPANFFRVLIPLLMMNILLRITIKNENITRMSNKQ